MLRRLPPSTSPARTNVLWSSRAAVSAAVSPAMPPPATTMSYTSRILEEGEQLVRHGIRLLDEQHVRRPRDDFELRAGNCLCDRFDDGRRRGLVELAGDAQGGYTDLVEPGQVVDARDRPPALRPAARVVGEQPLTRRRILFRRAKRR